MSNMPPEMRDDHLSSVYRAAPADEPPAALDDAIRAAARRAVGARPRATGPAFFARWQMPLSAAAVLVICASLIVVMRDEGGELTQVPRADAPKPASGADRRGEAASAVPKVELAPEAARSKNIGLKQPAAPANVPATGADAYSLASPGSAIGMRGAGGGTLQEGRRAAEPPAAEALPRRVAPPPMNVLENASADRALKNDIQSNLRRDSPAEVAQPAASADSRGAAPVSPAPATPVAAGKLAAAADAETPMRQRAAVADQMESDARAPGASVVARSAGQPSAASSRAESVAAAPAARPVEKAAKESLSAVEEMTRMAPDKWIARIEELRQAGRLDEARAGLAEFRRRFPDYALPASLRGGISR